MTEEDRTAREEPRQGWSKELEEALDRTSEAVRTAWQTTRESRQSALESARRTVKELGQVLEEGLEAARDRWEGSEQDTASEPTPTPGDEEGRSDTDETPPTGP